MPDDDADLLFKLQESLRAIENRNDDRMYAVTLAHVIALGSTVAFLDQHAPFCNHLWAIAFATLPLSFIACTYVAQTSARSYTHFSMQAHALKVLVISRRLKDLHTEFALDDNVWGQLEERAKRISTSADGHTLRRSRPLGQYFRDTWSELRDQRGTAHVFANFVIGLGTATGAVILGALQ